jgi:hypothetical protein
MIQAYHSRRCYERTRGGLMVSVVAKALKRQAISEASHETDDDKPRHASVGEVVNLVSGDSYSFGQWARFLLVKRLL